MLGIPVPEKGQFSRVTDAANVTDFKEISTSYSLFSKVVEAVYFTRKPWTSGTGFNWNDSVVDDVSNIGIVRALELPSVNTSTLRNIPGSMESVAHERNVFSGQVIFDIGYADSGQIVQNIGIMGEN